MLGFYVGLHLEWNVVGVDETLRLHMRRIAYACRYGKAAAFVWEMDSELLNMFCEIGRASCRERV